MPRNIFMEDRDTVLLDMAQVESVTRFGRDKPDTGLAWLSYQDDPTQLTMAKALAQLRKHPDASPYFVQQVYGAGGWNRWFLHPDGQVVFSGGHAHCDGVTKARELGFEVNECP